MMLGDSFTVADLNVHAVLGWASSIGKMKFDGTPNLAGWLKRCAERPALARSMGRKG